MVTHTSNLRTWEMGGGRSEIQSHPKLHHQFKASLSYLRTCLKITELKVGTGWNLDMDRI